MSQQPTQERPEQLAQDDEAAAEQARTTNEINDLLARWQGFRNTAEMVRVMIGQGEEEERRDAA